MRPLTPLFLTLALLLCSCRTSLPPSSSPASQEADQGSYRIGVSFPTTSLLFRSAMFQLLEEFDLSEGSVELILCDGENSQEKQNQDLVNLIDDPVDGIILIPYTMEGPLPAIQYANDRGIPVLTLDNRVESSSLSRTIGYVGAEHVTMGEQAARLLISALEEHFPDAAQWNVIYLTGIPNSSGAVDRDTGITVSWAPITGSSPASTLRASWMTASMFTLISMGSSAKMTSWPRAATRLWSAGGWPERWLWWASTASVLWWRRSPLAA